MDEPVTPDNTRVLRIMGDFREFMRSSSSQPGPSTIQRGIPFNISTEEDNVKTSGKRTHSTSEAFANAKIAELRSKHVSDERAHKLARLDLESRNEKLLSENKLLREKCDNFQLKVKELTIQAINAQDKLNEFRLSKANDKENLEETLLDLQKEKEENERDLQQKIEQLEEANSELRQRASNFSAHVTLLREKLEETTTLLGNKMNRVEKLTQDLKDHEKCEITIREQKIQIKELESRISNCAEAEQFAKVMKDDLERLRVLELEVVKLHDQNELLKENESNVELMKEKLSAVESKLTRNEKRLEKAAIIELENKELQVQLDEAKTREIQGVGSEEVMSKLLKLQQSEAVHVFEKGQLDAELASYKMKCEALQDSLSSLEANLLKQTEAFKSKDTQLKHLHRRALLLTGERNSLRGILQSYDAELTATSHADQLLSRAQNAESANEKVHSRLADVEKQAQDNAQEASDLRLQVRCFEDKTAKLERLLEEKASGTNVSNEETEKLRKKVEDLAVEKNELQQQKERLELWVERNKMRGDFDPVQTRVLHFQMNPADLAHKQTKTEVAELKARCIKLQQKILKLEENQDVTTTDIDIVQSKEVQEKLTAAEMKNQRLKEVFSKKIQEFRQACYSLTGFRIDLTGDAQFKLVSMYAENETDYLLFNADPSGAMNLLETEYSKSLSSLIELHLHHQNSIPMFLSSLTADLFSQQTIVL